MNASNADSFWQKARENQSVRLFLVSLLTLFVEIVCIRWLGIEVSVMRIFPNLALTAILIGFSIGLATCNESRPKTGVLLICIISTFAYLIAAPLFLLDRITFGTSEGTIMLLALIGILVTNLTMIFVTMGRLLGKEFSGMPPLKAYAINLAGSIAGVLLIALLSFSMSSPAVWIGVATLLVWLLSGKKFVVPLGVAMLIISFLTYSDNIWSPYGRIKLVQNPRHLIRDKNNYVLQINGEFFHGAEHFEAVPDIRVTKGSAFEERDEGGISYRIWLETPFIDKPKPKRVLILGSGSGNDVRCAILHDAEKIDAVEINPVIAKCGFEKHPDRPYADPRVNVHVEDARTFLRYSKEKYDLIEFAYLDPGKILRMSSFLRSDNFVYTRESIESAISHLAPDGMVSVMFATGGGEPATKRLYKTICDAYGAKPYSYVHDGNASGWGSCFFQFGPGAKPIPSDILAEAGMRAWPSPGENVSTDTATDDWPFLYLEYSTSAVILYFFVLMTATLIPILLFRKSLKFEGSPSELIPMFFLGMAFMLMETKAITKLSLLFGATWIVSSVVIFTILCLAVLANWIADRFAIKKTLPAYIGLTVMLLVDYFVKIPTSSSGSPMLLSIVFAVVTCAPVFFGGLIFSTLLNRSNKPVAMMSANVLGVALGGLLENLCIVAGIKSLSLVALILYLISGVPTLIKTVKPSKAGTVDGATDSTV